MTYDQAKQERDRIEHARKQASQALDAFPRLPNGLTPDDVKQSPAYREAKAKADALFAQLQAFNTHFVKTYKADIRRERASR
jgi:hypothetical protein